MLFESVKKVNFFDVVIQYILGIEVCIYENNVSEN